MDDERNDRNHQQDMDQAPGHMEGQERHNPDTEEKESQNQK